MGSHLRLAFFEQTVPCVWAPQATFTEKRRGTFRLSVQNDLKSIYEGPRTCFRKLLIATLFLRVILMSVSLTALRTCTNSVVSVSSLEMANLFLRNRHSVKRLCRQHKFLWKSRIFPSQDDSLNSPTAQRSMPPVLIWSPQFDETWEPIPRWSFETGWTNLVMPLTHCHTPKISACSSCAEFLWI